MLKDPRGATGLACWQPGGKQGGGIGALGAFLCMVAVRPACLCCVVLLRRLLKVQSLCSGVGCCTVGCESSRAFEVPERAPLTVVKTLSAVLGSVVGAAKLVSAE
jgi:hypothetical protein